MKKFFSTQLPVALFLTVVWFAACKKEDPAEVISGFSFKVDASDYRKVTFTSAAQNASSLSWDFGDGTSSTETDPIHNYTSDGTFTVKLTAKGDGGTDVSSQVVSIADPNVELTNLCGTTSKTWKLLRVANANRWPYEVGPFDKSQIWWAAGRDNDEIAARYCDLNDEYTFSRDGKFKFDTKGDFFKTDAYKDGKFTCETSTAANLVSKDGGDLSAWGDGNFTYSLVGGAKPTIEVSGLGAHIGLTKVATDAEVTVPQTSVKYDIVKLTDGQVDTLILEVGYKWDAASAVDQGYWRFILVHYDNAAAEPPITSFKVNVSGKVATCTNNSIEATSYLWDFGDGTTSTEKDPVHTYTSAGNFTIKLTGTKGTGTSSYQKSVTISGDLTESDLIGAAWKVRTEANSIFVGPGMGNKDWWQVSASFFTTGTGGDDWSCIVNDEFIFSAGGAYEYKTNGDARNDGYMGKPNGCMSDAQVSASGNGAAFGSGKHTWAFTPAASSSSGRAIIKLTNGASGAAFIGFYKGYYGGENGDDNTKAPNGGSANTQYEVMSYVKDSGKETLTLSVDISENHDGSKAWSVVLVR